MWRSYFNCLCEWQQQVRRKPLVVRGARQVGKTHLISEFGRKNFEQVFEINFDRTPEKRAYFKTNNTEQIIQLLEADFSNKKVR